MPNYEENPRDKFITEHVTTIDIPEQLLGSPIFIKIEFFANSGDWKSGWVFEGFSVAL